MGLDARKGRILAAIVSQYIRTGEPVGSKSICDLEGINVSSATVRNEMAALFDMGLLEQPHTSAGRIPSHLGYRVYIDSLMRCDPLTQRERDELDALFNVGDPDPDRLVEDATERLAHYTGCATVSATMASKSVHVKRIELIRVDDSTVVILVMANNGVIKNKVVRVGFRVTQDICDFFTNFANGMLRGKSLYEISLLYLNSVAVSLGEYSRLFTPLLAAIYELCKAIYDGQFYLRGGSNLLSYHEFTAVARELFALLDSRERMTELLYPQGSFSPGTRVTIGKENHAQELCDTSLLVACYRIGTDSEGAIGIIGPVRLPYARLIPHLDYFANTLGKLLSDTYRSETQTP